MWCSRYCNPVDPAGHGFMLVQYNSYHYLIHFSKQACYPRRGLAIQVDRNNVKQVSARGACGWSPFDPEKLVRKSAL